MMKKQGGPLTKAGMKANVFVPDDDEMVTVRFNLPKEEFEQMVATSSLEGRSKTDVIRQALINDRYLMMKVQEGAVILCQHRDGATTTIDLRPES